MAAIRPKDQKFIDMVGAEADLFLVKGGRVLAYRCKNGETVALGRIGSLLRNQLLHIPRVGFDEWDRMLRRV